MNDVLTKEENKYVMMSIYNPTILLCAFIKEKMGLYTILKYISQKFEINLKRKSNESGRIMVGE